MVWGAVAPVDKRVVAIDQLHVRIPLVERGQIGIVFPQLSIGGADVSQEPLRIANVQITNCRREKHDVPRGKGIPEDYLF
jgi:hypothetical protein